MVLRVKRVVSRLSRPEDLAPTGAETQASWDRMMDMVNRPRREAERRLADVERALNRLGIE